MRFYTHFGDQFHLACRGSVISIGKCIGERIDILGCTAHGTTNDDVDVIVPNSEFINGRVTNWTYENRMRRLRIPFAVAYGTDKQKVKAAMLRAAARVEGTIKERPADVWLVRFGDNSLEFELVVWVGPDHVARPSNATAAYLWAINDELRAEDIEIPFPQRDLHLRSGPIAVRIEGAGINAKHPENTR